MFVCRRLTALAVALVMLWAAAPAVFAAEGAGTPAPGTDQPIAVAGDFASLEPLALDIRFTDSRMLEELQRYNDAVARFGDPALLQPIESLRPNLQPENAIDSEAFYSATTYFQVSPSGNRLFFISDGVPVVYDLAGRHLRVIAPDAGMDQEYFDRIYLQLLKRMPDDSLVWSADEQYLAVAAPLLVLQQFQLGANILLIDTNQGTARQLVPQLPAKLRLLELDALKGIRAPLRAGFDTGQSVLYYEAVGAGEDADGARYNEILSYDLLSGQTQTIARYPMDQVDSSPRLWSTPQGVLHTYASARIRDQRGLAIRPLSGDPIVLATDGEVPYPVMDFRVLDMAGGRGLLWSRQAQTFTSQLSFMGLMTMDALTEDVFDMALAVDPAAAPEEGLRWLNKEKDLKLDAPMMAMALPEGLQPVVNGALSPDGKHMLLATSTAPDQAALWLYSFERDALYPVDLEEAGLGSIAWMAALHAPGQQSLRGLSWVGQNTIRLWNDGRYHLFTLSIPTL